MNEYESKKEDVQFIKYFSNKNNSVHGLTIENPR